MLTLSARDLVRPLGQVQLPRKVRCEHFTGQRLKCTVAPRGPARNAGWSRATPPKTGSFLPRMAGSMPLLGRAPHGIAWGPARSLEGLAAAPQTDSAVGPRAAFNSSGPSALAEGQAGPPSGPLLLFLGRAQF